MYLNSLYSLVVWIILERRVRKRNQNRTYAPDNGNEKISACFRSSFSYHLPLLPLLIHFQLALLFDNSNDRDRDTLSQVIQYVQEMGSMILQQRQFLIKCNYFV